MKGTMNMLETKANKAEAAPRRKMAWIIAAAISTAMIAAMVTLLVLQAQTPPDTSVRAGMGTLSTSYELSYLPNTLYQKPTPSDKEARLLAYVDKLHLKLDYSLVGFEGMPADHTVSISARMIARASESSKYIDPDFIVWQKDYELLKPTEATSDGSTNSLSEQADLDIHKCIEFASGIYDTTQESTINEIKLIFSVTTLIHGPVEDVTDNSTVELIIPMLDNLLVVTGTPKAEHPLQMRVAAPKPYTPWLLLIIVSGGLALASAITAWMLRRGKHLPDPETMYVGTLTKTFKQYGERLVRLDKPLCHDNLTIMPINGIGEMVKIADEVSQPVFYFKAEPSDEKKIEFYVFDAGRVYYHMICCITVEGSESQTME